MIFFSFTAKSISDPLCGSFVCRDELCSMFFTIVNFVLREEYLRLWQGFHDS